MGLLLRLAVTPTNDAGNQPPGNRFFEGTGTEYGTGQ